MRASLKIFGSALSQVVHQVETQRGESAVLGSARLIAAGLALSAAAGLAHADGGEGSMDNRLARSLEQQQAERDASAAKMQEWKNAAAKAGGGLIGGVVGNSLTKGAGTLWRTVATLGGAAVGAVAGNALVPGPDGKMRDPIASTGDMNYDAAVAKTFSPATTTGQHVLPLSVHANLAGLMTNMAAHRLVAAALLRDNDDKEMAAATAPRDAAAAAAFQQANRTYQTQFTAYASAQRDTAGVLKLAESKGYDVAAQRAVFNTVPGDLRKAPAHSLDWPGVATAAADIGERAGLAMNYAEMSEHAETPAVAMRLRQK